MNLIEALKTGLPIARKNYAPHKGSHGNGFIDPSICTFTMKEILAEDWEVEEQSIEITKERLARIWDEIVQWYSGKGLKSLTIQNSAFSATFDFLCKKIGFK